MKALKISLLLLMLFSLTTAICYGQTAKDYCERGIEYGVAGEFEEAQQEFKKALEIDPFYEAAKEGLQIIEDVLKERIKTGTALYLFEGVSYVNKGMHGQAIAAVKKAIEINPNYVEARSILGTIYADKEMYDGAIVTYKKIIEINPNYAVAHYNLGVCYSRKGMYDEAIAAFKKAIEINPDYADAHYNLAVTYYYKGQYSLAIKHCDRAVELGYRAHPKFLELLKPYREGSEI